MLRRHMAKIRALFEDALVMEKDDAHRAQESNESAF